MKRKVEVKYIPPERKEILKFSATICSQLHIPKSDGETIRGLSDFLGIVSSIEAKKLSSDGVSHE